MTFTNKDRNDLVRLRTQLAELEAKEKGAIDTCVAVLKRAGLQLDDFQSDNNDNWARVIWDHADDIRDALEPFDSGVRCGREG